MTAKNGFSPRCFQFCWPHLSSIQYNYDKLCNIQMDPLHLCAITSINITSVWLTEGHLLYNRAPIYPGRPGIRKQDVHAVQDDPWATCIHAQIDYYRYIIVIWATVDVKMCLSLFFKVTVSHKDDTGCVTNFGRTSAAGAFVSGILALALEAK
jgi:hypothetical protein